MYDRKVDATIYVSKQLEILEEIIKNPDQKINDLIKDTDFNGLYTDLVISLSQFLMNKDKAITKAAKHENERFKNWILDRYIEIYRNNEEMQISDFVEQVNAIRNAIGHGKYIIDEENLNIELLDRQKGEISYKWIRDMIQNLFTNNKNKLKKLPIKTGYIAKLKDIDIDINNIEEALDNFYMFEYNITSENEDFNQNGLEIIQNEIEKYRDVADDVVRDPIQQNEWFNSLKNCKDIGDLSGINLKFENKKLSLLDENIIADIKKVINDNYDILKNASNESLQTFINGFMDDFYFDSNSDLQIDKAYSQIGNVAKLAELNINKTYNEIKKDNPSLPPTNNQMLLATTLVKFNMLYSYNDDNILREYMDFSKMDLDELHPTINYDVTTKAYRNESDKIKIIEKDVEKKWKKYQGMQKIPNPNEEKKAIINGINITMYNSLFDILDQQDIIRKKRFAKNEKISNEEKYVQNKMIITHMRNSITHGNITINSRIKNNDMSSCIITFKDFDIETGKQTFELTTTLDKINAICDYKTVVNLLNQNPNYKKDVKSYSGFTTLFMLCLGVLFLLGGTLIYILILNNYLN